MDTRTEDDSDSDDALMRRLLAPLGRRQAPNDAAMQRAEQTFRAALAPVVLRRKRTRRRAWLSALSGLQAVSATMMRTGLPATLLPCCSQNSSCPRTVSWPDLASAPVRGARKPMRISSCALATDTTVLTMANTTAAVSRLMASSSGARSEVAHIYHEPTRRERAPGGVP